MDPAFFWIHTSFVASKLDTVAPPIPDIPSAVALLIIPDALETRTLSILVPLSELSLSRLAVVLVDVKFFLR